MSDTKKVTTQEYIEHPLEEVFDIEPGTTLITSEHRTTELTQAQSYDEKDDEIENQFQEVYDAAMDAFEDQMGKTGEVEGKFRARNSEVAVQFLNTALAAARDRSHLKQHKDKIIVKQSSGPQTVNNNLIIDRNDLLRQLKGIDNENQ